VVQSSISSNTPLERPQGVPPHEWSLILRARTLNSAGNEPDNKDDFDRYFEDPCITIFEPTADYILKYWKNHAVQYPDVAKAARDLLAVPSAEVNVESLFSEGRDLLGIRRKDMDGDTMRTTRLLKSHWDLIDKKKKEQLKVEQARHMEEYGVSQNLRCFENLQY
jgi:hypothetical protein